MKRASDERSPSFPWPSRAASADTWVMGTACPPARMLVASATSCTGVAEASPRGREEPWLQATRLRLRLASGTLLFLVLAASACLATPAAAQHWTRILTPDGAVQLRNEGVSHAQHGAWGQALLHLEQAHALAPWDAEIRDTLALARVALVRPGEVSGPDVIRHGDPESLRWWRLAQRFPTLPCLALATLFAWLWAVLRMLSVLRPGSHPPSAGRGSWLVALSVALALLGTVHEAAMQRVEVAVVIDPETRGRRAPDELAPAHAAAGLGEGAVVRARGRVGSWVEVEVAGGQRHWVEDWRIALLYPLPTDAGKAIRSAP